MLRQILVALLVLASGTPLFAGDKSREQLVSELSALIDQADEMVVFPDGSRYGSPVYRFSERKDFDELKSAITLSPEGGPFVCACVDGPEIALLRKGKEIGTVWNHDGTAIGSSVWEGDWETSDPDRWLRWFDARGMKEPQRSFNAMQDARKKEVEDEKRWLAAMPSSLRPLWPMALKQYQPWLQKDLELAPFNEALVKEYPDGDVRIRALMAWYGSGAGPWSGFPAYEEVADRLLRQYSTEALMKAAQGRTLTEQELEGAARILGGWRRVPDHTLIPEELRRTLLEHCLKSSDPDKVERARRAFASAE